MGGFLSKKILVIGVGVLILLAGIEIGLKFGKTSLSLSTPPIVNPVRNFISNGVNDLSAEDKIAQKTNNQKQFSTDTFKVTRVIDGDTIEIEGGERVRYIGIDTPETVDPRKSVQCFGVEAANKNKELVLGKIARLEKDITDRDKYNRLLRYVYIGDTFINLELVKQGFAYSYSYPPDIKYQEQFLKAQREAREAKRGLWNTCPAVAPAGIQISVPQENSFGDSCLIKGNISALGKIYHLPDCGSYSKTKIDEARGEKWFCAETEAQAAGWRKALNCP